MDLQTKLVVRTAGVQQQVPLAASEDPAERHLHETEDELLHTRGRLYTEGLVGGDFPHEPDVEVSNQGRKYHELSVFFHEREGQMFPSEVLVLHVEGAIRRAALQKRQSGFALKASCRKKFTSSSTSPPLTKTNVRFSMTLE